MTTKGVGIYSGATNYADCEGLEELKQLIRDAEGEELMQRMDI